MASVLVVEYLSKSAVVLKNGNLISGVSVWEAIVEPNLPLEHLISPATKEEFVGSFHMYPILP